jgi:hypothetical protein
MAMPQARSKHDIIYLGESFSLTIQRTLRLPADGQNYALPQGLNRFSLYKVEDFLSGVPAAWKEHHQGFFLPMYQCEALWLSFDGVYWRPNAIKIGYQNINAVTGLAWTTDLHPFNQDYLVCPNQPWLDAVKDGAGQLHQFVQKPINLFSADQAENHPNFTPIELRVFAPRPGIFPDQPPVDQFDQRLLCMPPLLSAAKKMGLTRGGNQSREILADEYGVDTWDPDVFGVIKVYLIDTLAFHKITGNDPPPTPVTPRIYADYGLPWLDRYNEDFKKINPAVDG